MSEPAAPSAKADRSLLVFYIGLGVIAALIGLFSILWTPLRVWHWERQARVAKDEAPLPYLGVDQAKVAAAMKLATIGEPAQAAFRRLLASEDSSVRYNAVEALSTGDPHWALSLLVDAAKQEADGRVQANIVSTARYLSGHRPSNSSCSASGEWKQGIPDLLAWWEREGKAKYDRGGK